MTGELLSLQERNENEITRYYPTLDLALEAVEEFARFTEVKGPFKNDVALTSFAQYKIIIASCPDCEK